MNRDARIDGYLRLDDVLKIIPVGRSTWWRGIRDGTFPQGIHLGPRITAWRESDIRDLADRLAAGGR